MDIQNNSTIAQTSYQYSSPKNMLLYSMWLGEFGESRAPFGWKRIFHLFCVSITVTIASLSLRLSPLYFGEKTSALLVLNLSPLFFGEQSSFTNIAQSGSVQNPLVVIIDLSFLPVEPVEVLPVINNILQNGYRLIFSKNSFGNS
jgi:hypothetical protein